MPRWPKSNRFVCVGNNGKKNQIEIRNIGSGLFNANAISNWHYDNRYPLIQANPGGYSNVYAPTIVKNGTTNWNIYFGGWDGTSIPHDEISIVNTQDNFETYKPHSTMIRTGVYDHVNNGSAIKLDNTSWCMLYTTFPNSGNTNKPAYATSVDGAAWTPRSGNPDFLITMDGYKNWESADVNGANVIYYEDGYFHFYFLDFKQQGISHARSLNFVNYSYQESALKEMRIVIVNDMKRINGHYVMGLHANADRVWISVSQDLSSFPPSHELFQHMGDEDRYITSVGFISDKSRLYGALYGASRVSGLDQNSIYAIWLQKQVFFKNAEVIWGLGNASRAYGPDNVIMLINKPQATGRFFLYDTDGRTMLYKSLEITVREGDIWKYNAFEI